MSKKKPVMSHDPLADIDEESDPVASPGEETRSGDTTVGLGSTLTIAEAADMHEILGKHLEAGNEVIIDGGEVEIIDGAGLQLVAAFVKEVHRRELPLKWRAQSEPLQRAIRTLGLADSLGSDAAPA